MHSDLFSAGYFGVGVPSIVAAYAPTAARGIAIDAGCGRGAATAWLAAAGFDAIGVDKYATPEIHGARFQMADVATFDYAAASPSLIVACHVLQFLGAQERRTTLTAMRAGLQAGGVLIVESFTSLDSGFAANLGHFAPGELGRWLISAGFDMLHYREAVVREDHEPHGPHTHAIVSAAARRARQIN